MQTFTTTAYHPHPHEQLRVVKHEASVSIVLPGTETDSGQGFAVRFCPRHLPALQEAIAYMERLVQIGPDTSWPEEDPPTPEHVEHDLF